MSATIIDGTGADPWSGDILTDERGLIAAVAPSISPDDGDVADRRQRVSHRRDPVALVAVVVGQENLGAVGHVAVRSVSTSLTRCDNSMEMSERISAPTGTPGSTG